MTKDNRFGLSPKSVFVFVLLFLGIFIFFENVKPVIPWDGDDWGTLGSKLVGAKTPFPVRGNFESERMTCSLLGTLFGYLAAFVIYPILGDYILSIAVANALALALAISVSLAGVYLFIKRIAQGNAFYGALGTSIFFLLGFVMLKTREGSAYLYWQYNLCTIYFYSIPSYLSGTFGIFLIMDEVFGTGEWPINWQTAILASAWYLLNFSFLPAAIFLAAIAVMVLLLRYMEHKEWRRVLKEGWFYWMILFGTALKLLFEFLKTFGTGYFKAEGDLLEKMKKSLLCVTKIFGELHPLFLFSIVLFALAALWVGLKRRDKSTESKKIAKLFVILSGALTMLFAFFVLFGVISSNHIYRGIPRLDTLYMFFFLLLLLAAICVVYVLNNCPKAIFPMPLLLIFMLFVTVSPKNSFSDSYYMGNSTVAQRWTIMQCVVEEAQRRDASGETGFVVHMPQLSHYGGRERISEALQYHNITSRYIKIEFQYENRADIVFTDIP